MTSCTYRKDCTRFTICTNYDSKTDRWRHYDVIARKLRAVTSYGDTPVSPVSEKSTAAGRCYQSAPNCRTVCAPAPAGNSPTPCGRRCPPRREIPVRGYPAIMTSSSWRHLSRHWWSRRRQVRPAPSPKHGSRLGNVCSASFSCVTYTELCMALEHLRHPNSWINRSQLTQRRFDLNHLKLANFGLVCKWIFDA